MSTARKKPPRLGRPPLPKGEGRVWLDKQRVTPETLRYLERVGPRCGGVGRAIDAAVLAMESMRASINAGAR